MNTKTFLLATILLISSTIWAKPTPEEGKTIFSTRCAGCHNVNKVLTGPTLVGVDQRRSIMSPGLILTFAGLMALLITTILFAIRVKSLERELKK
jgi:cytochrome c2